ncbi:hypothetical protein [Myroides odoratimimus]|uniref:hypothetical protein n=1 Tax=Myroides odoratimimus TaxID=76832 RepID=UPI003101057A
MDILKTEKTEKINLDNLILNENAYFYKKEQELSKNDIVSLFKRSRDDKNAKKRYKSYIREPFLDENRKEIAAFSLDIFEYKTKPSFLKKEDSILTEIKFGLFLIVETDEYLGLIRRNVSGIQNLKKFIVEIDYEVLSKFLINQNSKFEKIVSNGMNTSDTSLQKKVSEGRDLKGIYSRFGASKEILNSIRIDDDENKHSIALNTSRVNSFNLKNDFKTIINWILIIIESIKKANIELPYSGFLDAFAKPIKFDSIIDTLKPTYLLIRFSSLLDEIESGNIKESYTVDEEGVINPIELKDIIKENEGLYNLIPVDSKKYKSEEIILKINKNSISINNKQFSDIQIEFLNGYSTTLNKYLNIENSFIVNFDKIDYVYSNRKIFRDSKLFGNLDHFFDTFIVDPSLIDVKSEKGNSYNTSSKEFKNDSIFSFIETKLAKNSDVLICEDLGTEFADFISVNNEEIIYYHAKYNKVSLSASKLEEVFGQAQKNLGFLELNNDIIELRKDKWLSKYKTKQVTTDIDRIRKCPKGDDKIEEIKKIVNSVSESPHLKRKVYVVINFIEKSKLISAVNTLNKGEKFKNDGVILQILWFVNSLLSSSLERNVDFRIICRP